MDHNNITYYDEELNSETRHKVPAGLALKNILLPNEWVFYLYNKQLFKKIANRPNFKAKPHKEVCTIKTVNDLIYLLKLMEVRIDTDSASHKTNLDMNDYIIMRKGIEPIWEDPKNSNGGTFTIKMLHAKGYDVWSTFVMYILGETLGGDMQYINGITVSYIPDQNQNNFQSPTHNPSYTYIKIWDGKPNRTRDEFVKILPPDLFDKIKDESIMYSRHNEKKSFNDRNITNKLNIAQQSFRKEKGGFHHPRRNT